MLQNIKKLKGEKSLVKKISEKKSHNAKKTERGFLKAETERPLGFFNIHSVAKHKKIEEKTLWRKFGGQFVWIEKERKKRVTIVDAFHFMNLRLKTFKGTFWRR